MGINFRGTASRLKQMTEKRNPAGFQEKSAAGPRDGVGGEKVSVDEAAKKFAERKSPFKMKKNFYGGEAYFSDGYGGPLKKSNPITQRSSPMKINMALIQGAADVAGTKGFHDVAEDVKKGFEPDKQEHPPINLGGTEGGECPNAGDVKDADGNCGPEKNGGECPEGQKKNDKGECVIDASLENNNNNNTDPETDEIIID